MEETAPAEFGYDKTTLRIFRWSKHIESLFVSSCVISMLLHHDGLNFKPYICDSSGFRVGSSTYQKFR